MTEFLNDNAQTIFLSVLGLAGTGVSGMALWQLYGWWKKPTLASNVEIIERACIAATELGVDVSPEMSIKKLLDEHQRLRLGWKETR